VVFINWPSRRSHPRTSFTREDHDHMFPVTAELSCFGRRRYRSGCNELIGPSVQNTETIPSPIVATVWSSETSISFRENSIASLMCFLRDIPDLIVPKKPSPIRQQHVGDPVLVLKFLKLPNLFKISEFNITKLNQMPHRRATVQPTNRRRSVSIPAQLHIKQRLLHFDGIQNTWPACALGRFRPWPPSDR
jgi:hypothetical protein